MMSCDVYECHMAASGAKNLPSPHLKVKQRIRRFFLNFENVCGSDEERPIEREGWRGEMKSMYVTHTAGKTASDVYHI